MATQVSEKEARQVAEDAREQDWKLPSFGKGLFMGDYRLDLIHPQPKLDAEKVEKGERFLATLREFLVEKVDALQIERDAKIPDEVLDGLKEMGALGMKVPQEYGGLGLSQVYYNRALMLAGSAHASISTLLSAHQSIGVAEPLMLFGSEEQKREWLPKVASDHVSAFLLTEPDVGSDPARLGSTATPTEDGRGYTTRRAEAVGHQRRYRRHRGDHGQGAEVRALQGRHQRLRAALRRRGRDGDAPQRVHGPERHRELGHQASRTSTFRRRTGLARRATGSRSP
ncbi:MAG: acyl-CoA dehydrogenase family protein [Thermoleophilaceae bacterium]